jgi:hypothetical protein
VAVTASLHRCPFTSAVLFQSETHSARPSVGREKSERKKRLNGAVIRRRTT